MIREHPMCRKLVLFDIDGTLVLTGGAGVRAIGRACADLIPGADGLSGVPVAGRTDRSILADVAARAGLTLDEPLLARLRDKYVANLREEIERPGHTPTDAYLGRHAGIKAVMPGIRELLDVLHQRDDVFLALLTGNFEAGARIKLEHFDLWRYFRCGAYGDDAADRNALVPFAVERARHCGLPPLNPENILVVGDTPHDISCARASDAVPVAVATGGFTADELRAAGADIVFENLSDTQAFLRLLD
jgi:phosphoglycolate phosphatase-like HAD superfamily hydrolase